MSRPRGFYCAGENGAIERLFPVVDILAAIEEEPEFPHDMSDRLYERLRALDKPQFEALLRAVIRMAKNGILDRVTRMAGLERRGDG